VETEKRSEVACGAILFPCWVVEGARNGAGTFFFVVAVWLAPFKRGVELTLRVKLFDGGD